MKILQVIPYFCFGGAEIMCENLCYALKAQGQEVAAVSLYAEKTPIAQRMEEKGIAIYYLNKKLGLDLSMIPKLKAIMVREKPDVVHTHLDVIKYAVPAARLAGVKSCIHTVHSVAHKEAEGRLQKLSNTFFYKLGWSRPVALSPEVRETVAKFYQLDRETVPVIFNGVDLSRCLPKCSYAQKETVTLLHVGRFDLPKNHPGLLRSFRQLLDRCPQCRLELVGDGDSRPEIEMLIRELRLSEAVRLHGMQSDVYPYLQDADIFVLPSLYEGIPMTILEAMGTGLPIAATNVGGIPDLICHGQSGLLCDWSEENFASLCEQLVRDPQLRQHLGQRAREESMEFSAQAMARNYLEEYRR